MTRSSSSKGRSTHNVLCVVRGLPRPEVETARAVPDGESEHGDSVDDVEEANELRLHLGVSLARLAARQAKLLTLLPVLLRTSCVAMPAIP